MIVFIFRRDFRIYDNLGLLTLSKAVKAMHNSPWMPIFIIDPQFLQPNKPSFNPNSAMFMFDSLLGSGLFEAGLRVFYGSDADVLSSIHSKTPLTHVFYNVDLTPYARQRDAALERWCEAHDVRTIGCEEEYSLVHLQAMPKPYRVFTPFYRIYHTHPVPVPRDVKLPPAIPRRGSGYKLEITKEKMMALFYTASNPNIAVHGGRQHALRLLKAPHTLYDKTKDDLGNPSGTTLLSAYLKYGCISVREAFHAFKKNEALTRQLYWRAFFEQFCWWFPDAAWIASNRKPNSSGIDPSKSAGILDKWKKGTTGVPLIDAAMRQLNTTGFMHNRARMVCASWLVKTMGVDWREGERYFSSKLTDVYHPANRGNWMWVAGYRFTLNPEVQAKRFDKGGRYVLGVAPPNDARL